MILVCACGFAPRSDAAAGGDDDNAGESDAAIGYTGRLQLRGEPEAVPVWCAFFGAPSCSIGGGGGNAAMDKDSPTANGVRLVRADPPRAETELANAAELNGAIALIYRGACAFTDKAQRAQAAGAVAVVFVNSDDEETHPAPAEAAGESGAALVRPPLLLSLWILPLVFVPSLSWQIAVCHRVRTVRFPLKSVKLDPK